MLLITDVHGCYYTLRRLLRKCPDEPVVFLGDLIDRGPHSADVVRFAMDQKVPTVCGNHEDLALFYYDRKSMRYDSPDLWILNGGQHTLDSYGGGNVPADVLDWMEALPMELSFDNLLVSHTGVGKHRSREASLWSRDVEFPEDGRFRVFGHTQSRFCLLTPNWARIDTGAAYASSGYGTLSALQWPSMRVFDQRYDESTLEPVITAGVAA